MLRKLAENLTARVFFITLLILLVAVAVTFGLVSWATPVTYTAVVNDDLARQVDELVEKLSETALDESGALLDEFIRTTGSDAVLMDSAGNVVDTGSKLAISPLYENESTSVTVSDGNDGTSANGASFSWASEGSGGSAVTVMMSEQSTIATEVKFSGSGEQYSLYVSPRIQAENLAVRALAQMAPWLLLVLLIFSLLCALVYSRYITRPVVRLSGIAERMAELDFNWECGERRKDEIGALGRSLNQMSHRLSTALTELENANHALRGEMEQEREMERQRMAFFSAASHELKTPVTILEGQLAGMLDGVGVYRDRDKYLLRSLQVTRRMENLIQEMLSISRMESATAVTCETIDLSALTERRISMDGALFEQRGQRVVSDLEPDVRVTGDARLLDKAIGNLLSNASLYSPEGAKLRVRCAVIQGSPTLAVENTEAHIQEDALPHLFEAFYRAEGSRSRSTGGSGLGLYLVRMILDRHNASCKIENTSDGVLATVTFNSESAEL